MSEKVFEMSRSRVKGGLITGSFPSLKMKQSVSYKSTLQRDVLFFLEYDPLVVSYQVQSFVITAISNQGIEQNYTPDFYVSRVNSKDIVDCLSASRMEEESTQEQLKLGQCWAEANGYEYVVITDMELRAGHRLTNLKLLWRYSRVKVQPLLIARCADYLAKCPDGLSIHNLASNLSSTRSWVSVAPCLYNLIFHHILDVDLKEPLDSSSVVSLRAVPE